jgi:hypothetical protein
MELTRTRDFNFLDSEDSDCVPFRVKLTDSKNRHGGRGSRPSRARTPSPSRPETRDSNPARRGCAPARASLPVPGTTRKPSEESESRVTGTQVTVSLSRNHPSLAASLSPWQCPSQLQRHGGRAAPAAGPGGECCHCATAASIHDSSEQTRRPAAARPLGPARPKSILPVQSQSRVIWKVRSCSSTCYITYMLYNMYETC